MRCYVTKPGFMHEAKDGHGVICRAVKIGDLLVELKKRGYSVAVINGQDCILNTLPTGGK
jgi:hypothetical protein